MGRLLRRLRNGWRNLFHPRAMWREVEDELQDAYETLVEERMSAGLSEADARREATLAFGRVETVRAQVLEARAGSFWDPLVQDVRYGVRVLIRRPLFTIFAVSSLALAIGATGAIFSLYDQIVLRRLSVPEPQQLVLPSISWGARGNYSMPYPQYVAFRDRSKTLSGITAMNAVGRGTLTVGGESAMGQATLVTGEYYRVLGLTAAAGRLLSPDDDRGAQTVLVLNYDYWQRRFGGRADVIGAAATVNGVPFTIIGVEPPGFSGTETGRRFDFTMPMHALERLNPGKPPLWNDAFATWIEMIGRIKPGVTIAEAEAEMKPIFTAALVEGAQSADDRKTAREWQLRLESGMNGTISSLRDGYGRPLQLMLVVLGSVLLLASLNVATLLLSHTASRQRELATRLALGAGRLRIVRQLLTESLLLAMMAATLGFLLAGWGSQLLLHIAMPNRERPLDLSPSLLRVGFFTLAISAATCLVFGLIPAIRSTSSRRLIASRQLGGGRARVTLDRTLIATQVALSLVLLVGAGLFLRTLGQLWAQETGYDRHNVLMFSIDARLIGKRGADVLEMYRRVRDELRSVPGADAITVGAVRPVSDSYYFINVVERIGDRQLGADRIRVAFNNVAPHYFETLGIPLVAGRDFDEHDTASAARVVIVSERMARHLTGNPIGQRIGHGDEMREVIGVVRDIRYASVKDAPREVVYYPMWQELPLQFGYTPTFVIRYAGSSADVVRAAGEAVAHVDPALQLFATRTLEEQTHNSLALQRLMALLMSYFGGFALILSCIGLYGVMSDRVSLRTAEIGLRLALGATQPAVRWLVLREALITVLIGTVFGFAGAWAAVQLVRSQLFGIEPHDPATLVGATAALMAIAGAAAYLPARRASRIDPLGALRHE